MQNTSPIPEDSNTPSPYTETRQQCLDGCLATYNQCIVTPIAGETPAQRMARCQSAYSACCAACPVKEEN